MTYKPYRYIDLSADEALAKRRWLSPRDSDGHRGARKMPRDYVYVDRGARHVSATRLHH